MIETERLTIGELKREDVPQILRWERNFDILVKEYDFIDASDGDPDLWFKYRQQKKRLRSFSVKDKSGEVVGFISIRNINRLFGSSILGITFNEKHTGKGYGTEALGGFLNCYFNQMKMRTMILDVGKYNQRAVKCYQKLGFETTREYKLLLEKKYDRMAKALTQSSEHRDKESFIPLGDRVILVYYRMKLKKRRFKNCEL